MERVVAYLRVSTQQQQRSGLGIEAQRAAIERFAAAESLTMTATVWVLPAASAGITTMGIVPDWATCPNPYGPTEFVRI